VLGIALLGIGAWKRFEDVKHSDPLLVIGGVSSLILSAIVLVPYFNLRVEHMMRLYEFVGKQRRTTDRKQSPASPAGGLAGSRGKSASSRKKKKSDEANPT
jgi:hypothetical protein